MVPFNRSDWYCAGSYLKRMKKVDSDRCWFCNTGKRQSVFHLAARCPAWAGQARVMWKRIQRLCEKGDPVTPSVRVMFGDSRATSAVLMFLRDTRVRRMVSLARGRIGGKRRTARARERRAGRPTPECTLSFVAPLLLLSPWCTILRMRLSFVLSFAFPLGCWGPYYDQLCRCLARENGYVKRVTAVASAAAESLPWTF